MTGAQLTQLDLRITATAALRKEVEQRWSDLSSDDERVVDSATEERMRARAAHEKALQEWHRVTRAILLEGTEMADV